MTCDAPFDWTPGPVPAELRDLTLAPAQSARRPSTSSGRIDGSTALTVDPKLAERVEGRRLKIAAYDFGMKRNILHRFTAYGCDVRVFPATAPVADLLSARPDGVFLSNGPGDPAALDYAIANVQAVLAAKVPVFGICLGHQLLGLAMGARTFKLKFGHRGANHPVMNLSSRRVEITAQNHGYEIGRAHV